MIRIIVFVLCLLPGVAFGATYNFTSQSTCLTEGGYVPCEGYLAFSIDPSQYGI